MLNSQFSRHQHILLMIRISYFIYKSTKEQRIKLTHICQSRGGLCLKQEIFNFETLTSDRNFDIELILESVVRV